MKFSARFLVPIMFAVASVGELNAQQTSAIEIYPTGVWPDDVRNVQAAADLGGTVHLRAVDFQGNPAAFNFGIPKDSQDYTDVSVKLNSDVSIVGEEAGSHRTTIQGGNIPFFGLVPVKVRIQGIHFENPYVSTIVIRASTGLEITGNRISGVVPLLLPVGFTEADGMDIGEVGSGKVKITGNIIENLTGDFSIGIQIDGASADVEIAGNTVHVGEVPGTGSVESDGILAIRCHGRVDISRNAIHAGAGTVYDAILIAGDHDARFHVSQNTLKGESPLADGIAVVGGVFSEATVSPVIRENAITLHNSQFGSISFYGSVTGASVRQNHLKGDAAYALQAAQDGNPDDLVTNSVFLNNDISKLTTSVADIFFDTNTQDNLMRGECNTFVDEGLNNRISCSNPGNRRESGKDSTPRRWNGLQMSLGTAQAGRQ